MSPPGRRIPFYSLTILINYLYRVESISDHHYQEQQTHFANPAYHPILNTQYYDFNGTDIGNSNTSSAYYYDTASSYQQQQHQQQPLNYYYQYDSSSSRYSPEKDYGSSSYIVPYSKPKDQETAGVHWRLTKRHPSLTKRRGKYDNKRIRAPSNSRSAYRLPSRRRHYNNKFSKKKKNKWMDHRQGGFFDDVFEEFSLDSILPELPVPDFLLRGLHDYDLGQEDEEEFDDLFDFGSTLNDYNEDDEMEPEESYHRPWALGGVGSYGRHPMSFGSYGGGMRDRVQSPSKRRVFGRYGMKAALGKGFKFLIALLLLPLILLFIPIPITIYTGPKGKNSRNDDLSSSASENSSHAGWGSIHDLSRRFLSSENCIERISCEIKRFQHDNGPESQDHSFTRFIRFVKSYGTSFFPSFLVRVARGYTQKSEDEDGLDNQCVKFTCENLQGFLAKKKK